MNGDASPARSDPSPRARRWRETSRLLLLQNLGLNAFQAVAFLLVAGRGSPSWETAVLVLLAFFGARNVGHAFNQIVDRQFDARNPRTRDRPLVTGALSVRYASTLVLLNAALVLICAGLLNRLVLALAPLALLAVTGYSFTKRVTSLTTVVLGAVQALVPAGVYLAVRGGLGPAALAAIFAALSFGTAFEIVHSLRDLDSDRQEGFHSLPLRLGEDRSRDLLALLLGLSLGLFGVFGVLSHLFVGFLIPLGGMAAVAAWQVAALRERKRPLSEVFQAHFWMGALFLGGVLLGLYLPGPPL
jgi:4-hydroxybenzoate polyprenyltransferase